MILHQATSHCLKENYEMRLGFVSGDPRREWELNILEGMIMYVWAMLDHHNWSGWNAQSPCHDDWGVGMYHPLQRASYPDETWSVGEEEYTAAEKSACISYLAVLVRDTLEVLSETGTLDACKQACEAKPRPAPRTFGLFDFVPKPIDWYDLPDLFKQALKLVDWSANELRMDRAHELMSAEDGTGHVVASRWR